VTHSSTEVSPAADIAAARDLLGRYPLVDGHKRRREHGELRAVVHICEEDCGKLARGNILRVMRGAEAASRAISARRGPSRARIEDLDG
jgi:hypothetical protein